MSKKTYVTAFGLVTLAAFVASSDAGRDTLCRMKADPATCTMQAADRVIARFSHEFDRTLRVIELTMPPLAADEDEGVAI